MPGAYILYLYPILDILYPIIHIPYPYIYILMHICIGKEGMHVD